PNLLASRRAANEASGISTLRTIGTSESTYSSTIGFGAYGTLAQLSTAQLVDTSISNTTAAAPKSGYFYGIQNAGAGGYNSAAAPATSSTGTRNFASDEAGVIYANTGSAGALDYTTTGQKPIGN
ncbi:MAG: hypothetical protein DMF65_03215, partial [Acidobacteria bacterium]